MSAGVEHEPAVGLNPDVKSVLSPVVGLGLSEPSFRPIQCDSWLAGAWAILNPSGEVVAMDEALAQWLAMPGEDLRGLPFWPVLWRRFPHWQPVVTDLLANGAPFGRLDLSDCARQTGQWFTLETALGGGTQFVRLSSALPPRGEPDENGWTDSLGSEPAQRELYVRLKRAEEQLMNLMARWPGVIFSQRPDLSLQFVSERIVEWTGIPVADWQRNPGCLHQVIHEADEAELQQLLKRCATTVGSHTGTFRIRHTQTGRVTYVRERREALFSQTGLLLGYECIWLDVSRQTIAESRLSSASWMETLATLTAGLVHDFSNLLAGVQALGEAFQAQLPPDHPFQEGLALIKSNTQNATQIVRRILSLHQGKIGQRAYHDLNELVRDLTTLVKKTVPRRVMVRVDLADATLPVYVDPVELQQVFVNLVLNAVEAMPETGNLNIRTLRQLNPPGAMHVQGTLPTGPCVGVEVRDEGLGIPAHRLPAIFEPYHTSKPGNKGSGLGLYNARLFAEKHRGALAVDSTENVGSTFCLWLPQTDFTEAMQESPPSRGRRTLLLIGAPGKCLDTIATALRQQGHYVVTPAAGEDPMELLSSPDYEFSGVMALAVSRETVPETLFRHIRARRLPIKIIFQIVGCNQDEFAAPMLQLADLVMAAETSVPEMLANIGTLLEQTHSLRS
ncbi:MAG: PAS domain-containing protein [Verrucomicrobia bacterium]|nr:PAS domain-containing protein [Verrucomicrobiota bacterium]